MVWVVLVSALAAAPQTAQLVYEPAAGLTCPDATWVRSAIAARLGRDPFVVEGWDLKIAATVRPSPAGGLEGQMVIDQRDRPPKIRRVTTASSDCLELASALELAIAVIIDPLSFGAPDTPKPAPAPVVTTPVPPAVPPAGPKVGFGVAATVGMTGGLVPGVTSTLGVGVAAHLGLFSLELQGRVQWPTRLILGDDGIVSFFLYSGSLIPCVHAGAWGFCAVATVGGARVDSQTDAVATTTAVLASVGGTVSYSIALLPSLELRPFVRFEVPVARLVVTSHSVPVWASWPVTGVVGVQGEFRIPVMDGSPR